MRRAAQFPPSLSADHDVLRLCEKSRLRGGQRSLLGERRSESIHVTSNWILRSRSQRIYIRKNSTSIIFFHIHTPKMLFFGVLSIVLLTASAEYCYSDVQKACGTQPNNDGEIINCNAQYGAIVEHQPDLQAFATANIETSFEFLLMSTHFGNYEAQREGFKGLYRKLSDQSWADAIDLIKYITKRGGRMDLNQYPHFKKSAKDSKIFELTEMNSLAKALDTEKQLASEALNIHAQAQLHTKRDADIAHYIEEHFTESLSERVRDLAGYSNDLKNLLKDHDPSVSLFLFDEYLKKAL